MRRQIMLPLSVSERKLFIATDLVQNRDHIATFISPLLEHENPGIRYGAAMTAAYALAKIGIRENRKAIESKLKIMRETVDSNHLTFPVSDLEFLNAQLALEDGARGAALEHLARALYLEPRFFNAAVLAASIRTASLGRHMNMPTAKCIREYKKLIQDLVTLLRFEPCPRMAVHVETYLSRQFESPSQIASLAVARIYLSIIAWDTKRANHALSDFRTLMGNNACMRTLSADFQNFISLAASQLDNK
jgi:hypothetical protein